jgi:hypothetical protein
VVSGHAYPWDVIGDPAFPSRVADIGVDTVTLAAAYHSTRAATPLHPTRRIVDARYAALYRPVREVWRGRRLAPLAPTWVAGPDPFAAAAEPLRAAGLRVNAWIVLTHNTRLGTERPDLAVVNCFGEPYPYALCPAHEEVRSYAALLAAEAVRDAPVDGISLEACGQLGVAHLGHHEKTDGAFPASTARLLSICCCTACAVDPARMRAAVAADSVVGLDDVLAARLRSAALLRSQVLDTLPPGVPVTLHAHPDPWVTGPSPGVADVTGVDAVLVPCWPTGPSSADVVAASAKLGRPVDAYVTALPPADPGELPSHVARLRDAGADRLSLYHLGLAPPARLSLLADLARI